MPVRGRGAAGETARITALKTGLLRARPPARTSRPAASNGLQPTAEPDDRRTILSLKSKSPYPFCQVAKPESTKRHYILNSISSAESLTHACKPLADPDRIA